MRYSPDPGIRERQTAGLSILVLSKQAAFQPMLDVHLRLIGTEITVSSLDIIAGMLGGGEARHAAQKYYV